MARVYVGNLPSDISERELDDLFYKFGRIREIDIPRIPKPPQFAFIEYYDWRDADDAVRRRDNYSFAGSRLRCEIARGGRDRGDNNGRDRDRPRASIRRTEHGVLVSNLPRCSWQDLKDFMRGAGDVIFANVEGTEGEVEFSSREDVESAVRKVGACRRLTYSLPPSLPPSLHPSIHACLPPSVAP